MQRPQKHREDRMTATECALDLDAAALKTMAGELTDLLRLKSLPFGLKLYEDIDEMAKVPGLRRPGEEGLHHLSIGHPGGTAASRSASRDNLRPGPARANIGQETRKSSVRPADDRCLVRKPRGRLAHQGRCRGCRPAAIAAWSPRPAQRPAGPARCVLVLRLAGADELFINGLQYRKYRRYDFTITGESACADRGTGLGHA